MSIVNVNDIVNVNNKELKDKILEYLEYKKERKEIYKEKGLNSLLKQIEKNCNEYGIQNVIDLIDECMASNYKGIIWDKLKKPIKPKEILNKEPSWFNEEIKKGKGCEEMEKLLEEFK